MMAVSRCSTSAGLALILLRASAGLLTIASWVRIHRLLPTPFIFDGELISKSVQPLLIVIRLHFSLNDSLSDNLVRHCFKSLRKVFQSRLEFVILKVGHPRLSVLLAICTASRCSSTVREITAIFCKSICRCSFNTCASTALLAKLFLLCNIHLVCAFVSLCERLTADSGTSLAS